MPVFMTLLYYVYIALLLLLLLQSVGLSAADCGLAHITCLAPLPADQVLVYTDCIDVNFT